MVHALALLFCGLLARDGAGRALVIAGWSFGLGVLFFSGSLYWLSLDGPRFLGPVTPLGGVAFIVGWLALAAGAVRSRKA